MSKDMKFVEGKAGFINEMAGFISYEAGAFRSKEEGDANAKVDGSVEKAIRFTAEKNKHTLSEIKRGEHAQKEHTKKEQCEIKKEKRRELKKISAKLAVAKLFQGKKEISKELVGKGGDGEDAFADGANGLNGLILTTLNPLTYLKMLGAHLAALLTPVFLFFMSAAAIVAVTVMLLFSLLLPLQTVGDGISDFLSIFTVNSEVFRNAAFSASEIDELIEEIGCDGQKETLVRFALSKVGYPYSQPLRTSGKAYDCSSLAYYVWKEAGVDISYGGGYPPTAAAEASMLSQRGKTVASENSTGYMLEPGDLVFYGGSDNGRYLGIYHVAIYIGNGMAVEALNETYGVVLQTLRTKNAILAARPSL